LREQGKLPEQALSSNSRQTLRRSLRLFGGREALLLEEARDAVQAREFLSEMAELHNAWWQARGQPGVFSNGRLLRFLDLLIATGHPGSVQVLRLRDAEQKTIGISFNLVDRDTVYYYQSGLRSFADPRCKPGLCLHLLAMEQAQKAGRGRYDFMASDLPYKQSLSNSQRSMVWAVVERPRLRLVLERLAQRAVRRVRTLRAAF
jgi:CelD/BcsL family acetyltransferase involved in cellulose biosynthesis